MIWIYRLFIFIIVVQCPINLRGCVVCIKQLSMLCCKPTPGHRQPLLLYCCVMAHILFLWGTSLGFFCQLGAAPPTCYFPNTGPLPSIFIIFPLISPCVGSTNRHRKWKWKAGYFELCREHDLFTHPLPSVESRLLSCHFQLSRSVPPSRVGFKACKNNPCQSEPRQST